LDPRLCTTCLQTSVNDAGSLSSLATNMTFAFVAFTQTRQLTQQSDVAQPQLPIEISEQVHTEVHALQHVAQCIRHALAARYHEIRITQG
jgi:hypothetical protein